MESFQERLESAGVLADDLRRELYLFIREQRRAVGREEAAKAIGVSHKLAAFHLDKLVEKGLLSARYERLTGRSGPGAGRPAKVYEPSDDVISVSVPYRSYDVVGEVLLDALETAEDERTRAAVREAAHRRGAELGEAARGRRRPPANAKTALDRAGELLTERGYEPYRDEDGGLRLHNCPFHDLARRSPEVVCGINQAFVEGLLDGMDVGSLTATLEPKPGECCVKLRSKEVVT